jgi:uncharacterized protein (TIGR03437 family)
MGRSRLIVYLFCAGFAAAQSSTNLNLNLTIGNSNAFWSDDLLVAQTGAVASFGSASLVMTSSSGTNNGASGPAQITFELAFSEADTIAINFTVTDPNFNLVDIITSGGPLTLSGGTITGGTGAYAGASGSLDLTVGQTSSGSGTLTVGGNTMPLELSNFHGSCCGNGVREKLYVTMPVTVSGSLGNGTGTLKQYYYFNPLMSSGSATITFNSNDSLTFGYSFVPTSSATGNPPSTFNGNLGGGTGKYANAVGSLTYKTNSLTSFSVTGTMTTAPGAVITQVKTVYGLPQIAGNTWLEVHGQNLVPADTPSTGVDWSNAPEFASGMMPAQLGPVGVGFGGAETPGYIFYYCSAKTNPNCADDQINVLAPPLGISDPANMVLSVLSNGVPIARTAVFRAGYSPAFLSLDAKGHIAARHLDESLVGPSTLYPGLSTPAKVGETISLYGTGFGPVSAGIVPGSSSQSGPLGGLLYCWVSGFTAQVVGALVSPGLYQFNLTIPQGVTSGDNPVVCVYAFYATFPGALIAVQ